MCKNGTIQYFQFCFGACLPGPKGPRSEAQDPGPKAPGLQGPGSTKPRARAQGLGPRALGHGLGPQASGPGPQASGPKEERQSSLAKEFLSMIAFTYSASFLPLHVKRNNFFRTEAKPAGRTSSKPSCWQNFLGKVGRSLVEGTLPQCNRV